MASIVPEQVVHRSTKPAFGGAVVQWGHACQPAIREILEGSLWHAEGFVDRSQALSFQRA